MTRLASSQAQQRCESESIRSVALRNDFSDNGVNPQTTAFKWVYKMRAQGLSITLHGSPGTSEYQAAEWLRDLIRSAVLPADNGTVAIYTDLYLSGFRREQIDILLHAQFPSVLKRRVRLPYASEAIDVSFLDIIAVIEVKSHKRDKIDLRGTNAHVLYRDGWKSASAQSAAQVYSIKQFISHQLSWSPYVCNLLLFPNLRKADLPATPNNFLAADSTFQDFIEKLCTTRRMTISTAPSDHQQFSCTPAASTIATQTHHKELQALLGARRPELTSPHLLPRILSVVRLFAQHKSHPGRARRPDLSLAGVTRLLSLLTCFVVFLVLLLGLCARIFRFAH
jgi:hypothetical protein